MKSYIRWQYLSRSPQLLCEIARGEYRFTYDKMPMHLRNMSLAKRVNLLRSGLNLLYRRLRPWSWPIHMQIELTSFCNLSCPVCPTGKGELGRSAQCMDVELYERLMDEVGRYLLTVSLWGWGEPLLHPQFEKFVRISRRHGALPLFSTNGQNLDDPGIRERLLTEPPEHLIVALDGITQETNARYRVGSSLEKALTGVRALAEEKRRRGQSLPILHMRYLILKHNEHELPLLEDFARKSKFDTLTLRTLSTIDGQDEGHQPLVPEAEKYRPYEYEKDRRKSRRDFLCQHAFALPTMMVDGTVTACDQDFHLEAPYGRLGPDGGFGDIWFGKQAQEFRRTIRDNRRSLALCRNCPYADRPSNTCSVERVF